MDEHIVGSQNPGQGADVDDVADPHDVFDVEAVFIGDYPESGGPQLVLLVIQPDFQACLAWAEGSGEWANPAEDEDYVEQVALRRTQAQERAVQEAARAQQAEDYWNSQIFRRRWVVMCLLGLDSCQWVASIILVTTGIELNMPRVEGNDVPIQGWVNLADIAILLSAICLLVNGIGTIGSFLRKHIVFTVFVIFEFVTTVVVSMQGLTFFILWRVILLICCLVLRGSLQHYQVLAGLSRPSAEGSTVWVWSNCLALAKGFCCLLLGMDPRESESGHSGDRPSQPRSSTHPGIAPSGALAVSIGPGVQPRAFQTGMHPPPVPGWSAPVFLPMPAVYQQRLIPMTAGSPLVAAATPSASARRPPTGSVRSAISSVVGRLSGNGAARQPRASSGSGRDPIAGMPIARANLSSQGGARTAELSTVHTNPYYTGSHSGGLPVLFHAGWHLTGLGNTAHSSPQVEISQVTVGLHQASRLGVLSRGTRSEIGAPLAANEANLTVPDPVRVIPSQGRISDSGVILHSASMRDRSSRQSAQLQTVMEDMSRLHQLAQRRRQASEPSGAHEAPSSHALGQLTSIISQGSADCQTAACRMAGTSDVPSVLWPPGQQAATACHSAMAVVPTTHQDGLAVTGAVAGSSQLRALTLSEQVMLAQQQTQALRQVIQQRSAASSTHQSTVDVTTSGIQAAQSGDTARAPTSAPEVPQPAVDIADAARTQQDLAAATAAAQLLLEQLQKQLAGREHAKQSGGQ